MPVVTLSRFTIDLADALKEFEAAAEADIKQAHGEAIPRPRLTGVPEHRYHAALVAMDRDQKDHDEEMAAQQRSLDRTTEP